MDNAPVRQSERFNDAVSILLLSQPFFGNLLLKMKHVVDDKIPTLYVSRRELHYNPDFLDSLDPDEAIFVVAHEVMHQAWQHLPRLQHYLETGVGPDGEAFDPDLYNQALDYPMNHALQVAGIGRPMPKEKFPLCLDAQRFPETMMPEEVYCILKQDQRSGKGGGNGKPLDEHDGEANKDGQPDAITPADILQAAEIHKAIKGAYPGGMERILNSIRKPDKSPWARLRKFVTSGLPGADRTSWRRLQRRMIVRGVGMPGPVQQGAGVVGVVADTSGSIYDDVLNLFGGHLAAIMDDARPLAVRIYWTDTKVNQLDVAKTPSDVRRILSNPVKGGGGTNMPRGVQAALDDKCDIIVVLTDGETPFGKPSPVPTMWAITNTSISAPHGETIHI